MAKTEKVTRTVKVQFADIFGGLSQDGVELITDIIEGEFMHAIYDTHGCPWLEDEIEFNPVVEFEIEVTAEVGVED